ncbi:hypothetical protein AYJ57_15240 [Salipiger sp. CCB-MM3]|nr:hypothetical protein AYJ57_15240 [Salipiger sp. CCB-MM3]
MGQVTSVNLDPAVHCAHSMLSAKVAQSHRKTVGVRVVRLLLGYIEMDRGVRYLGADLVFTV